MRPSRTTRVQLVWAGAFVLLIALSPAYWSVRASSAADIPRFSNPVSVTELNSTRYDYTPWLSEDGLEMYLASDRDTSTVTYYHIYHTTRTTVNDPFNPPLRVTEVNQPPRQHDPSLTSDSLTLYFTSWRPGGADTSIWLITRTTDSVPFDSATQQLVPNVNPSNPAIGAEGPWISPDGLRMYFDKGGTGMRDIYFTTRTTVLDTFSTPVPVSELNTTSYERYPRLTQDELTIFFASDRPGGFGQSDVYVATRNSPSEPFGPPQNVASVNSASDDFMAFFHEGTGTIYFCSNRNSAYHDIFRAPLLPPVADLEWSTFLGGTDNDWGVAVDANATGDVYATGFTGSTDFPTSAAYDPTYNGAHSSVYYGDPFLSKFNAAGELVWSTYFGGSNDDFGFEVKVGPSGNVYLGGYTYSANFPTSGAYDATYAGGSDAYLAKFSPDGDLIWSTYLGGSAYEFGGFLAVDAAENIYIAGLSGSTDFPTSGAYDATYNSNYDAFVAKFSADGALRWSTYLGGSQEDRAWRLGTDSSGNVLVTGGTYSGDFPTSGGFDTTFGGDRDAFAAKFSTNGALLWATFLGGSGSDWGYGIGADGAGDVYVAGQTGSSDFPTSGGVWTTLNGGTDSFVVKLDANGALVWSTYFGGSGSDFSYDLAMGPAGHIYLAGPTGSTDFPLPPGTIHSGGYDAFAARFSPDGHLQWTTLLGGSLTEERENIAVGAGYVFLSGTTYAPDFPTKNAFDLTFNGDERDAFAAKLRPSFCVNFALPASSGAESSASVVLRVLLSEASTDTVTVDYDVTTGTATGGGVDYSFTSGTLTFAPGETSATINLTVVEDLLDEPDETVTIALSNPSSVTLGPLWQHTYTILDNDHSPTFASAVITPDPAYTSDTLAVITSGWSDLDGDPEGYLYQWRVRGVAVAGQTSSTLGNAYFTGGDWVTCLVTAWDGANQGNTIEAGPAIIRPLPIDIDYDFEWSTYLGGSGDDRTRDTAADPAGNIVAAGMTGSSDFPLLNAWDPTFNGSSNDATLAKFSPDGRLLWSTFVGGSSIDRAYGVSTDDAGNVYAGIITASSNFPTSGAFDPTYNGAGPLGVWGGDAALCKFTADGRLAWSTFFGGSNDDLCHDSIPDGMGNVYFGGGTYSTDFPTSGAYDDTHNGDRDAYIAKFTDDGTLLWSTFIGGSGDEYTGGLCVDAAGNVYFVGRTLSVDFPTSGPNAEAFHGGTGDGFVVKFSPDGRLIWSTCVGGSEYEGSWRIACDGAALYVAGNTLSPDFPTTGGWDTTYNGTGAGALWGDATMMKFDLDGAVIWSTYLGGSDEDYANSLTIDGAGAVWLCGRTLSADFPTPAGVDTSYNGGGDGFLSCFAENGLLVWSTYVGGTNSDFITAMHTEGPGHVYITGDTVSTDFPTTRAYDPTFNGGANDAFVAKLGKTVYLEFEAASSSGDESTSQVALRVVLSRPSTGTVTVDYDVTGGTATGGADYTLTTGTLAFNRGETSATIEIEIIDDRLDEADETVTVALSDPSGALLGLNSTHTYTILDNDSAPTFSSARIVPDPGYHNSTLAAITSGWSDADGDPEGYLYQWKKNGSEISGAIAPTLDPANFAPGDSISCVVTAWDGVNQGNTIETAAVAIQQPFDPELVWSTYFGGSDFEQSGAELEIDPDGNVYIVGMTWSADCPTSGAYDPTYNGGSNLNGDACVAKFATDGRLLWSTFLGGSLGDLGLDVALDGRGSVYVCGSTMSADFPTSGAYDGTFNGGGPRYGDCFVTKFSSDGSMLWSTYFGGSGSDFAWNIGADAVGDVFIAGYTESADLPTTDALHDTTYNGEGDIFLAKFTASGTLVWATYLGGAHEDCCWGGLEIDAAGAVVVAGSTASSDFPTSGNLDDTYNGGANDACLAKFANDGALLWSGYIGGSSDDWAFGIGVDDSGSVYVSGQTKSADFPIAGAFDPTLDGASDAFVTKILPNGDLAWSTYMGGSLADSGADVAVDGGGSVYISGTTLSADFPTQGGFDTSYNGGASDVFLVKLYPSGALVWSTYMGGSGEEKANPLAVDEEGYIYISGIVSSSDFPVFNAFDLTYNGGPWDFFLSKIWQGLNVSFDGEMSSGDESATRVLVGVILSKAPEETVTVDYDISSATAMGGGVDYTLTTGTLTFNPGEARATIEIVVIDDRLDEPDETIVLILSNPSSVTLAGSPLYVYTILDNDHTPAFASATIVPDPAYPNNTLAVSCTGWVDADGEPEGYLYQWTKNGADIPEATGPTLGHSYLTAGDSITCVTTAWDGANAGNSIETAPVVILSEGPTGVIRWRHWRGR